MRRLACLAVLLAAALSSHSAMKPGTVTRASLAALEASFDQRIGKLDVTNPFDVLGPTRGVYLPGFGVVFSTEVNLVITPTITPFRMKISEEEVARVHQRKLERLPVLRQVMREMLVNSAASLDDVPSDEQVAVAVTLFFFRWEDRSGMPAQLVLQAKRKTLVDYRAGRINASALRTAIHEQVF